MSSEVKYRRLEKGETIKIGDEIDRCVDPWRDNAVWEPIHPLSVGTVAPDPQYPSHRQYRRRVEVCDVREQQMPTPQATPIEWHSREVAATWPEGSVVAVRLRIGDRYIGHGISGFCTHATLMSFFPEHEFALLELPRKQITQGPSPEWVQRMSSVEDGKCVSVGVLPLDASELIGPNICQTCGVGFHLPSGRCDHCNSLMRKDVTP